MLVSELFEPPTEIEAIIALPATARSREDYDRVLAWFYEPARRSFLIQRVRRAAIPVVTAVELVDVEAIVDYFYVKHVRDLLRKAPFKNVGALFLKEFDAYLTRRLREMRSSDPDVLSFDSIPFAQRTGNNGRIGGATARRRRLRRLDRLLLGWASSQPRSKPKPSDGGDWVEATVFGPQKVSQGKHFLVQAFTHLPDQAAEARRLAVEFDEETDRLGFKTLGAIVLPGTRLTFSLVVKGLEVISPVQEVIWQRRTEGVAFGVEVPAEQSAGNIIGTVTVAADSVPIGVITFKVEVKLAAKAKALKLDALEAITTRARHYEQAFISYASQDRNTVLRMVQMLRIQGIRYFQDVLSLEPGDRWVKEIYRHIDECDLFLLFWSSSAKASTWVMKEVAYAIQRKAGDEEAPPDIHPVIIEGPPPVPPPPELAHLHFNDKLIYFMT